MNSAWPISIYRRLARAFPHEFKLAYGTEVMQLGEDVVEEIAEDEVASEVVEAVIVEDEVDFQEVALEVSLKAQQSSASLAIGDQKADHFRIYLRNII